jgi:hypothetical protein
MKALGLRDARSQPLWFAIPLLDELRDGRAQTRRAGYLVVNVDVDVPTQATTVEIASCDFEVINGQLTISDCTDPDTLVVSRPTSESLSLAYDLDLLFGAETYLFPSAGDFLVVDWESVSP